ncbi:MAG: OmpA family protein [Saprospiraceae bacterium]|nr:OmpA family protein [Saprospiraceae bacterium]
MRGLSSIRTLLFLGLSSLLFCACGKKLKEQIQLKDDQIAQLDKQLDHLRNNNNSLLDRLSDMSVISKAGSESIRESLASINQQYAHIQDLNDRLYEKDSINLVLVLNLKRSLHDVAAEDLQVEVRGGKVHVSISDRMLFQSGSAQLGEQAEAILGKIAAILNDHDELDVLVEGHTDNIPIQMDCYEDNWDLSASRATTVARVLHRNHYVSPERITAAGRSEFVPKSDNSTAIGRATNRRTEIIIMPKLDQFFQLMEAPPISG